jgi:spoIIIJ-associated protein
LNLSEKKYTVAETGPLIEDFLEPVLDAADFDVEYVVAEGETPHPDFENPEVMVKFSGPDVDLFLANKAEVLLALEHLTQEALHMPSDDHSKLCFDANDRRALRIEELRMSAATAADRVRKTHAPFHFSPLNSRERRILHLALRNEEGVRSESVGEGAIRQVVIVPADMKTLPEPVIPPRPRPEDDGGRPRFGGRGGRDGGRGGDRRGGPGGGRGGPRGGGGRGGPGGGRGGDRGGRPRH